MSGMEIVEIKCDGCEMMRKWRGYECLTFCDCLADELEDFNNFVENDLQIIYKNGKPHGIRDGGGYLLFFPNISSYTGQEKRYQEEVDQQNKLAEYLLYQLSKCSE